MQKLIETGLTYVKQGGPPDNWHELVVVDSDTGKLLHQVLEINTEECWATIMDPTLPEDRIIETWPQVTIKGNFVIMRAADVETADVE